MMKMDTALWFFDKIRNDKLCLLYNGSFSDNITHKFIELSEYNLESNEDLSKMKNRVSFLMAECFQNIVRHGAEKNVESNQFLPGFFSTRNLNNTYFITSGNLIGKKNIEKLEGQLKHVNSLNNEELKEFYKDVITTNQLSEKGGAGLGLIEMARKSGHVIEYSFDDYDDEFSFFYSQIKLSKDTEVLEFPLERSIDFHKKMNEDSILLIQKGDFSQESILPVLKIIEQNFLKYKGASKNKAVYHVLVELLQNIGKHGAIINKRHDGIFLIQRIDSTYTITTGNFVEKVRIEDFKSKLEIVQSANKDELEAMYNRVLLEGEESENGDAGLGLIDISRISNESINYNFQEIDKDFIFFTIQVVI
jgi:hypothetical protein